MSINFRMKITSRQVYKEESEDVTFDYTHAEFDVGGDSYLRNLIPEVMNGEGFPECGETIFTPEEFFAAIKMIDKEKGGVLTWENGDTLDVNMEQILQCELLYLRKRLEMCPDTSGEYSSYSHLVAIYWS